MANSNLPNLGGLNQPRDLRAGTLDTRASDRAWVGQLHGGLGQLDAGRGDSTAQTPGEAFSQTLGHLVNNRGFGNR
jgi:hypothetical protein